MTTAFTASYWRYVSVKKPIGLQISHCIWIMSYFSFIWLNVWHIEKVWSKAIKLNDIYILPHIWNSHARHGDISGRRGRVLLIFKLGSRYRRTVRNIPQALYWRTEYSRYPLNRRLGGLHSRPQCSSARINIPTPTSTGVRKILRTSSAQHRHYTNWAILAAAVAANDYKFNLTQRYAEQVTNRMEQSPSLTSSQEIPCILWNPNFHYQFHLDRGSSQSTWMYDTYHKLHVQ